MAQRKLFCELSPLAYHLSVFKCRTLRVAANLLVWKRIARTRQAEPLPYLIYTHKSLIRRKLGDVDPRLQENKAVNLGLAAPRVSGVLIRPGQMFSFWSLVGSCTRRKGYQSGLVIARGAVGSGVGGGMCQFTNLIHWLVLHTPLVITEHHHHDGVDLFPDFGRQVPFGVGTSILYNYLDYRFVNPTDAAFQLITYTDGQYLCGEVRSDRPLDVKYHVKVEEEFFSREADGVYRNNVVYREWVDKKSGSLLGRELLKTNHAKVLYDTSYLQTV